MPPPIRYPLPTLIALILAALLAWRGEIWTRAWRLEVAAQARRALEGPPVPRSSRPQVVAGPIIRRGLLLHDSTTLADRPKGPATGAVDRRMFVDIYDEWPDSKQPTHDRVGNRQPLGWIKASDLLPWNTRLVVRPPSGQLLVDGQAVAVGAVACPVIATRADAVEVATWAADHPWAETARRGWVPLADLPPEAWGRLDQPGRVAQPPPAGPGWRGRTRRDPPPRCPRPGSPEEIRSPRPTSPPRNPRSRRSSSTRRRPSRGRSTASPRPTPSHALMPAGRGLSFRFLPLTDLP